MIQIERCSSRNPSFHKCLNFFSAPILPLETRETLLQRGHCIVGELNCSSSASCERHTEVQVVQLLSAMLRHPSPLPLHFCWYLSNCVCTRARLCAVFMPEALLTLASILHTPLMTLLGLLRALVHPCSPLLAITRYHK